jgi:uncharacterized protein
MQSKNEEPELDSQADPLARILLDENISVLEVAAQSGWDIDKAVKLGDSWWSTPINIALSYRKEKLLGFLLGRGVNLNARFDPAVVWAIGAGCSESTLATLLAHGARLDATNQVGVGAYQTALYEKRFDYFPVLVRLGLPVAVDGGSVLRSAVFDRQFAAVKFLVEHGYDVNLRRPDMVFPNNPSAVAVAARNGDIEMVRYLVEHGADVTLTDEYGDRAYSHAVKAGNKELQKYLKDLEPAEWHTEEHHLRRVAAYEPPEELIAFLRQPDRRIELSIGNYHPKYIELHTLDLVGEVKWKGRKLLDLVAVTDGYDAEGYIVWSPHHRKVGHLDYNHDQLTMLCTWSNFIADPNKWIARLPT